MINTNDIVKRWETYKKAMLAADFNLDETAEVIAQDAIDMIERLQRATDEQFLIIQDYRLGASWKDSNRQEMLERIDELEADLQTASENFSKHQGEWWDKEDKLEQRIDELKRYECGFIDCGWKKKGQEMLERIDELEARIKLYDILCVKAIPSHNSKLIEELYAIRAALEEK